MEEHCSGNSVLGTAYFAGISSDPECNYEGKLYLIDNNNRQITADWNMSSNSWDLTRQGEKHPYKTVRQCDKLPPEISSIKIPNPGKEILVKDLFYKINQASLSLLGIKLVFKEEIGLLGEKTRVVWIEYFLIDDVIVVRAKLNVEDDRFKLLTPEQNFLNLGEIKEIQLVIK